MFSRVLITGAAGQIGSSIRDALRPHLLELRLSDLEEVDSLTSPETSIAADLRDAGAVERAVDGVDAIIHLGAISGERPFDELDAPNLRGVFNLYEAARRANVRRVIFASSHHVTGLYPGTCRLSGDEPIRPDSLYASTKAFGEAIGRMYVAKFGLEVICVRIGSFRQRPTQARHLHSWLSPADADRLFLACLSAERVGFELFYGVSRNTRGWWDLAPGRRLGFHPVDDAEAYIADLPDVDDDPNELQGGPFADPAAGGWAVDPY